MIQKSYQGFVQNIVHASRFSWKFSTRVNMVERIGTVRELHQYEIPVADSWEADPLL